MESDIIHGFDEYFENQEPIKPDYSHIKQVIFNLVDKRLVTQEGAKNLLQELGL